MSRVLPTYSDKSANRRPQAQKGKRLGKTAKTSTKMRQPSPPSPAAEHGPVQGGGWAFLRLALPLAALLPLAFVVDQRLAWASGAMLAWCASVALYAALRGWQRGGLYLYGGFALAYAALTAYLA